VSRRRGPPVVPNHTQVELASWWLYFDDVAGARVKARPSAKLVWVWAHFPLATAVTAAGVAIKELVLTEPGAVVATKDAWLLSGMLALAFCSVTAIALVTERRSAEMSDRTRAWVRMGAALVAVAIASLAGLMPAWLFFGLVAAVCLAEVFLDIVVAPLAPDPVAEHHAAMHWYTERARERHAELTAREDPHPEPPQPPARTQVGNAVRLGAPSELRRDL